MRGTGHCYSFWSAIRIALLFGISLVSTVIRAQDVKVRGGFFEDSVVVGDVARFYLTATYPSELNILFPDSTFNFAPLEYGTRQYFTTRTRNGISYDSVIYHLDVFELDSLQLLFLPVYLVNENDCTKFISNPDTLLFRTVIHDVKTDTLLLEKLPLKENVAYHSVGSNFNYPVVIIISGILLTAVAVFWFVFGKRIQKHYRVKRMVKAHQEFIRVFSKEIVDIQNHHTPAVTEATVAHWKKYMEQLERKPYTKLTSKEIQRIESNEGLGNILHSIDASIYGHSTVTTALFENLKVFTQERFHKKLQEVKNG